MNDGGSELKRLTQGPGEGVPQITPTVVPWSISTSPPNFSGKCRLMASVN
jgi:hypothetical protein